MRAAFLVIAVWPVMIVRSPPARPSRSCCRSSVATGIGFALFDVFWDTTMAEQIPPHALSRASAWEWMGSLALLPVGLSCWPARLAEATQHRRPCWWAARSSPRSCWRSASCRARRARSGASSTVPTCSRSGDGNTPNGMRRRHGYRQRPRARRRLARSCATPPRSSGSTVATTWELMLATTEAFANAVEHGEPCDPRGIRLRVEIRDGGHRRRGAPTAAAATRRARTSKAPRRGRPRHADHRGDHGRPRGRAGRRHDAGALREARCAG